VSGPLDALIEQSTKDALFPVTSRYHGIETATLERDGRVVAYLRRRFVPPAERFLTLQEHVVADGERPDTIAAHHLGDPEQFWRLCDANGVRRPNELTERAGAVVRVTLPEGLPGAPNG
jgi:hypothetical protein